VTAQRERQFARRDAVAVVLDDDRADAAAGEAHDDLAAPASSALSISSRSTEAGRSTTSPAAIWLISSPGSSRIGRRVAGCSTAFIAAIVGRRAAGPETRPP
jgi:hypothetical protein